MNLPLATLGVLAGAGLYYGYKDSIDNQLDKCLVSKIFSPIEGLSNSYYSNKGLIIDYVKEDSVIINTPNKELYGILIEGNSNVAKFIDDEEIEKIYRVYKEEKNSFFWYVIHKQGYYHKQYIFSYNKELLLELGETYESSFLSGNELANAILDLYLQNSYTIENKAITKTIDIDFEGNSYESSFRTFNKIAKENIYTNLNKTDLFQAYKMLDIQKTDIQKLFNLKFDGAIWLYFDINERTVNNHLDLMISSARADGKAKYFKDLKEAYNNGNESLCLLNSTAHLTKYSKSVLGTLSNSLKTDFLRKDINRIETLRKTPLKYRDNEFDYLAPLSHMKNYIASVHKKEAKKGDIWGYDKNQSFINFSFSEENENPHFMIIGRPGSGKSLQKQKMISQIINLDYETGLADYDNVEIRSYDIGFSDEEFVNYLKLREENDVQILSSVYSDFAYNLCNVEFLDKETKEADLIFQADLVSLILTSKGGEQLTIEEQELFKATLEKVYVNDEFRDYRVGDIEKISLKEKLFDLGYQTNSRLLDIKEKEYDYLKKPLLKDIINYCTIHSVNDQIKDEEKANYKTLGLKLNSVDSLKIFSRFDEADLNEVKFLSMDLNNFKESDLFAPIFVCIFQKRYLRDRERAIKFKRAKKQPPKVFDFIEEAKNYFRVPYFVPMFDKVALEARKYNIHLCLLAQVSTHIPNEIAKNIDTKIFLLTKEKKQEIIQEIKDEYEPTEAIIEQLNRTNKFEMCVWYSKGAFNMKFDVTKQELELFNTNANLIGKGAKKNA